MIVTVDTNAVTIDTNATHGNVVMHVRADVPNSGLLAAESLPARRKKCESKEKLHEDFATPTRRGFSKDSPPPLWYSNRVHTLGNLAT